MKTHEIIYNNRIFVVFEYAPMDFQVYYKENNMLYDESNGFPKASVINDYLHVQENWEDLI